MKRDFIVKNLRKQEGITLLVLAVTIIILLILAGISINVLAGENRINSKCDDG